MVGKTPSTFLVALQKWLRANETYQLADQFAGDRRGCGWTTGWCYTLAAVLADWSSTAIPGWSGWPRWAVQEVAHGMRMTDHVVVATPWGFLDADGFSMGAQLCRRAEQGSAHMKVRLKFRMVEAESSWWLTDEDVLDDESLPVPPKMKEALLADFRKHLGEPQDWHLAGTPEWMGESCTAVFATKKRVRAQLSPLGYLWLTGALPHQYPLVDIERMMEYATLMLHGDRFPVPVLALEQLRGFAPEVVEHEGRHRAYAAYLCGAPTIPVDLVALDKHVEGACRKLVRGTALVVTPQCMADTAALMVRKGRVRPVEGVQWLNRPGAVVRRVDGS